MLARLRSAIIVVASVALATLLTFPLAGVAIHSRSLLFVAAVIVTSRYAGAPAGICAALLSVFAFDWFFDATPHAFDLSWGGLIRAVVFCAVSLLVASLERQRLRAISALQETNQQLRNSLEEVKVLRGLLPVCSYCKQIRNEAGAWLRMETYIRQHSEAEFTHGICPDCLRQHFPDIYEQMYGTGRPE